MQTNKLITYSSQIQKIFWNLLSGVIDDTLSLISYIEITVPKSNATCFRVTVVKPYMTRDTLKMIHYSYFHSIINYGLIFWGK